MAYKTKNEYVEEIKTALKGNDHDRFGNLLNQKRYVRVKKTVPEGVDEIKWAKNKLNDAKNQIAKAKPEYEKAKETAKKEYEEKRQALIADTKKKIEELDKTIKEKTAKGESVAKDDMFKKAYASSLEKLEQGKGKEALSFSYMAGEIKCDLSYKDNGQYKEKSAEMQKLENQKDSFDAFYDISLMFSVQAQLRNQKTEPIRAELKEKEDAVNGLSGWQRFWAKILPVNWYEPSKIIADLNNLKSAIAQEKPFENPTFKPLTEEEMNTEPFEPEEIMQLEKDSQLEVQSKQKDVKIEIEPEKQLNIENTL